MTSADTPPAAVPPPAPPAVAVAPAMPRAEDRPALRRALAALYRLLRPAGAGLLRLAHRLAPGFAATVFGSDIFERYTARYTWLANQFGHVAIGIVLVALGVVLGLIVQAEAPASWGVATGLLLWGVVYVPKEVADGVLAERSSAGLFPPDALELGLDMVDDALFVLVGVLAAIALFDVLSPGPIWPWLADPRWGGAMVAILLVVLLPFAGWRIRAVLPAKDALDRACLPYTVRLARFNGALAAARRAGGSDEALGAEPMAPTALAELVLAFARDAAEAPEAIVLAAAPGATGRTWLACAIGCEATARAIPVRYLSWRARDLQPYPEALAPAAARLVIVDDCAASLETVAAELALPPGRRLLVVRPDPAAEAAALLPEGSERPLLGLLLTRGVDVHAVRRLDPAAA